MNKLTFDRTNKGKWSQLPEQAVTEPACCSRPAPPFTVIRSVIHSPHGCNASFTESTQARLIHTKDGSTKAVTRKGNKAIWLCMPRALSLIQLDDLTSSQADRVRAMSFLVLETSPGNFQPG